MSPQTGSADHASTRHARRVYCLAVSGDGALAVSGGMDQVAVVHDLLTGARYLWHGPRNYVELDPHHSPVHIFRLRRRVRTEQDFDYFA